MKMYDIIEKKKCGEPLSKAEIAFWIAGYTAGRIPDYQVAALLMAICLRGMNTEEVAELTDCMVRSGDSIDLSAIRGVKVDKHSTGGVGDKTTLVVVPIVAACGVPVAKMSGRGLGHTGGTIDKLEAIPGFQTTLAPARFLEIVNAIGLSVIGQSGNLVPADKKLYALRDVTATVDSLPLIASSIMSKKIAAGADCILLDVKTGSGAFMKTDEDARSLAKTMVALGEHLGRKTVALITDMNRPLGCAIGNSLEVIEAVDTLRGKGPADLAEICVALAADMLFLAGKGTPEVCRSLAQSAIDSGAAFDKLVAMVEAQGGDSAYIKDTSLFVRAPFSAELRAPCAGYVSRMRTGDCGLAAVLLGAGRETKESPIDHSAGILLYAKPGMRVAAGDLLATLLTAREETLAPAAAMLLASIELAEEQPETAPLIHARIAADTE